MDSQLYNADCIEVMQGIPDESIDLVLADPPYGTTQCRYDSVIDIEAMWTALRRIVKRSGIIVIFSKMPFSARLVASNISFFHQEIVWVKNVASNFMNSNRMHLDVHENIMVFKMRDRGTYNEQLTPGTPYKVKRSGKDDSGDCYGKINQRTNTNNDGFRKPKTVVYYDRVSNNVRCHPSQKPCELLDYLVKTYSNEGDTVLDFAMGSGSTGRSALTNGRNFIGIEKDKATFDRAVARLSMTEAEWNLLRKKRVKPEDVEKSIDQGDEKRQKQINEIE